MDFRHSGNKWLTGSDDAAELLALGSAVVVDVE